MPNDIRLVRVGFTSIHLICGSIFNLLSLRVFSKLIRSEVNELRNRMNNYGSVRDTNSDMDDNNDDNSRGSEVELEKSNKLKEEDALNIVTRQFNLKMYFYLFYRSIWHLILSMIAAFLSYLIADNEMMMDESWCIFLLYIFHSSFQMSTWMQVIINMERYLMYRKRKKILPRKIVENFRHTFFVKSFRYLFKLSLPASYMLQRVLFIVIPTTIFTLIEHLHVVTSKSFECFFATIHGIERNFVYSIFRILTVEIIPYLFSLLAILSMISSFCIVCREENNSLDIRKITILLLVQNIADCLLSLPNYIIYVLQYISSNEVKGEPFWKLNLAYATSSVFYLTFYSFNFWFIYLSLKSFRLIAVKVIKNFFSFNCCRRNNQIESVN